MIFFKEYNVDFYDEVFIILIKIKIYWYYNVKKKDYCLFNVIFDGSVFFVYCFVYMFLLNYSKMYDREKWKLNK